MQALGEALTLVRVGECVDSRCLCAPQTMRGPGMQAPLSGPHFLRGAQRVCCRLFKHCSEDTVFLTTILDKFSFVFYL